LQRHERHERERGSLQLLSRTPSIPFPNITTPNDELILVKEFNESRVGQRISLEVWDIVMFATYQDNTTNA
jgi:hypothetical protein